MTLHNWIRQFRAGRIDIVDKERAPKGKSGCSQHNIQRIESLVTQDRRMTIRGMSAKTGIPYSTIQRILKKDLKLKKRCSTFVPAVLTDWHKQCRRDICNFFTRLTAQSPRVLRNTVTMDESWIYVWDPDKRIHCMEWLQAGEPRPQTPRRTLATAKVMILTFFDRKGMIYYEYIQRPQTVNQQVFRAVFQRFNAAYECRRPRTRVQGCKFIHLDNVPAHNATLTLQLIAQLGWTRLPQPSYSPDLSPCNFWLFSRLKRNIRGVRFPNLDTLKDAVSDQIFEITAMEYHHCMMISWPKRWRCCLEEQGNFFEGHD